MHMAVYARTGLILILALLVAVMFAPSSIALGADWSDLGQRTLAHGWLILLICLVLIVRARSEIERAPARASPVALAALLVCVFAWLVCYRAGLHSAHLLLLPVIFWLAVSAAYGWPVARALILPAALFCLAEPAVSFLSTPLQDLAVAAVPWLLRLTGPQAVVAGDFVQIPNGTFEIQEGCSGLHSMIVGLAVAALHGELRHDRWRARCAQLALMALLALLANWLRIYCIIQVGYRTDMHSPLLREHYAFGWGIFAVALVAFFCIRAYLDPPLASVTPAEPVGGLNAHSPLRADLPGFALVALILVALPAASALLRAVRPAAPEAAVLALPSAPWAPALVDVRSSWQPVFAGADREQRLAFTDGGGNTIEAFTVTYRAQRQGAKLQDQHNSLLGPQLDVWTATVAAHEFRAQEVTERAPPHAEYLVWARYESAGRTFASPLLAQLWYGLNATVSNPSASLLALRAQCRPDCAAASRSLFEFSAGSMRRRASAG